jgi:hypothetical protein
VLRHRPAVCGRSLGSKHRATGASETSKCVPGGGCGPNSYLVVHCPCDRAMSLCSTQLPIGNGESMLRVPRDPLAECSVIFLVPRVSLGLSCQEGFPQRTACGQCASGMVTPAGFRSAEGCPPPPRERRKCGLSHRQCQMPILGRLPRRVRVSWRSAVCVWNVCQDPQGSTMGELQRGR